MTAASRTPDSRRPASRRVNVAPVDLVAERVARQANERAQALEGLRASRTHRGSAAGARVEPLEGDVDPPRADAAHPSGTFSRDGACRHGPAATRRRRARRSWTSLPGRRAGRPAAAAPAAAAGIVWLAVAMPGSRPPARERTVSSTAYAGCSAAVRVLQVELVGAPRPAQGQPPAAGRRQVDARRSRAADHDARDRAPDATPALHALRADAQVRQRLHGAARDPEDLVAAVLRPAASAAGSRRPAPRSRPSARPRAAGAGAGSQKPVRAQVGSTPWCTTEWQAGARRRRPAAGRSDAPRRRRRSARRPSAASVTPPIPRAARGGSRSARPRRDRRPIRSPCRPRSARRRAGSTAGPARRPGARRRRARGAPRPRRRSRPRSR